MLRLHRPWTSRFSLHTHADLESNSWRQIVEAWIERIEAESKGRIRIIAQGSETANTVEPSELYDAAKDGRIDIAWTSTRFNEGRFPRIEVFELPFVMTQAEAVSRALWEYMSIYAADEFKDTRVLALHVRAASALHTIKGPIAAVTDLRGLRIATWGRQSTRMLSVLGAKPYNLSRADLALALERGELDGAIASWPQLATLDLPGRLSFHTEFDIKSTTFGTAPFMLVMNAKRFDSLPAELKAIVERHSGLDVSAGFGQAFDHKAMRNREQLAKGDTITTLLATDAEAFRKATAAVDQAWMKDVADKGFDGQKLLDGARTLVKKYTK